MTQLSGIYVIFHKASGRAYVGQSSNVHRRWIRHRYDLRRGEHHNPHLQAAWMKHGEDAFEFEVVFKCEPDLLTLKEQELADAGLRLNLLYNIGEYLDSPGRGKPRSPEVREKCRQAQLAAWKRGRPFTEEALASIAAARRRTKGTKRLPEVGARISASKKGKLSEKQKQALKALHDKTRGRLRNDEFKKKVSKGMQRYKARLRQETTAPSSSEPFSERQ